jgi:preprotein translocase subunit SecG
MNLVVYLFVRVLDIMLCVCVCVCVYIHNTYMHGWRSSSQAQDPSEAFVL